MGRNLVAEMRRTRMTTAQVAAALGLWERQITRWRSGQEPRYESVVRFARLFDRDPEWFYADHGDLTAAA